MFHRMLFTQIRAIYTKTIIADLQTILPFCSQTMRGVLRIYNLQTEKSLLIKSENFTDDIQKIRLDLDLGNFSNKTLQDEYAVQGLNAYKIESLLIAEDTENLDTLLQRGKEKLEELAVPFYQH